MGFGLPDNFFMLGRVLKLRNVLHHKDLSARASHNFNERPPQLLSRIGFLVLIQKAKTLTRWATNHYICSWYLFSFEHLNDIVRRAWSDIQPICFCCSLILIIRPYMFKVMAKLPCEA